MKHKFFAIGILFLLALVAVLPGLAFGQPATTAEEEEQDAIDENTKYIAIGALIAMGMSEYLQWQYDPLDSKVALATMNTFYASLSLGIIYTIFQGIYFTVGHIIWRYNLQAFLVMVILSNGIAFGLSYMFIEMAKAWYYVA